MTYYCMHEFINVSDMQPTPSSAYFFTRFEAGPSLHQSGGHPYLSVHFLLSIASFSSCRLIHQGVWQGTVLARLGIGKRPTVRPDQHIPNVRDVRYRRLTCICHVYTLVDYCLHIPPAEGFRLSILGILVQYSIVEWTK